MTDLITRAVRHQPDGRATVRVCGDDVDVTAAPPPLPAGAVLRVTLPDIDGGESIACPDCGADELAADVAGHMTCRACGSEFVAGREADDEPDGPLIDATRALLDVLVDHGRPGAQTRLEAAQDGHDPELLAAVSDAAAELAAVAMRGRIAYADALAPADDATGPDEHDHRPDLLIVPDRGGDQGRAALAAAGVLVAHDARLRIADVVALDLAADEHHDAERVTAAALLVNPYTPLRPADLAAWLRRQADAIGR